MKKNALLKTFTKFVSANIMGMLGLSCYILADTFFVANGLGTNGLAALNLAISIYSVIHATGIMIGIGGATNFTILRAKGEEKKGNEIFTHCVELGVVIGLLLAMIGIFGADGLSRLLGADGDTFAMTSVYLRTILCFAPFFILNNIIIAFVRNDNGPRLAMSGMLLGSFTNIVLDYIFIFPLNMGMFGAAFATGLAPIVSLLLLSTHCIYKKNKFHLLKSRIILCNIKQIVTLGISSFVTEISSGVVLIIFNIVILGIAGNTGVAAYGIVANLSLVAVAVFVGIAQGMQPLVSTSCGQDNQKELKQLLTYAISLSIAIAILIYVLTNYFSGEIIGLFNSENNEQLAKYATQGLSVYFIGFLFGGVNIVCIAFFSACQKAQKAFALSCLRGLILIVILVMILPGFLGLTGVWMVFLGAELLTFLSIILLTKKKKMYTVREKK